MQKKTKPFGARLAHNLMATVRNPQAVIAFGLTGAFAGGLYGFAIDKSLFSITSGVMTGVIVCMFALTLGTLVATMFFDEEL